MLTSEQIKQIFKDVGVLSTFGTRKELTDLPKHIDDENGEIIYYACSAAHAGNTWLMVCTNQKLLFLDKGMVYGLKKNEIPISKVNSVTYKTGALLGKIEVYHGSSTMVLDAIDKKALQPMVDAINRSLRDREKKQSETANKRYDENKNFQNIIIEQNNKIIDLLTQILAKYKSIFSSVVILKLFIPKNDYKRFIKNLEKCINKYNNSFNVVDIEDIKNIMGYDVRWILENK